MKPEHPTTEKRNDSISDSTESHPAYAQIGARRVSSTLGANLYGSDFDHNHYITITISQSKLNRSLSRDWESAGEELIEVALSEAQWAAFVSTLNSGMGTQCTLLHINREQVPGIASKVDRKTQFTAEANINLAEVMEDAKKLKEEIERGGKKTVMRDLISGIIAQFSKHSGLSFISKQFDEHIEQTVEKAKIEVNAYVESRIRRAGLTALGGVPPISLPGAEKKLGP